LATWMADVMDSLAENDNTEANPDIIARVKSEVLDVCAKYPVYDYRD